MPKISKAYPAFYGGESEQSDELILDTQCRSMINCVPDVVTGVQRRNGLQYVSKNTSGLASKIFHTYDRGEGNEEYIFMFTEDYLAPIKIFDKDGIEKTVSYSNVDTLTIFNYMLGYTLRAITIQDRTFIVNTSQVVQQSNLPPPSSDYRNEAYYWLKRSSNDSNNEYRYAVYLNGVTFDATGSNSDDAAAALADNINTNSTDFTATVQGSIIKITTTLSSFTFASWDSWGNQASKGWKGSVNKLSDLPSDMPWDNVVVKITGNDKDDFTDYFVKSENGVWIETRDPYDLRGYLGNMPFRVDRLSDGTFEVSLIEWELPHVGDDNTNPTPSFVDNTIQDISFFKNRLCFVSNDSIVLSETGGYYNFYVKTALKVIDTDPIDITIASTQASKIYYVVPFQESLYLFTKETQLETNYNGTFSPLTVSIDIVSNYDIDVNIAPKVAGSSLFFISRTSDNKSQLREYVKDNTDLVVKGMDLTLNRPNMLPPLDKIIASASLGYIIMYSKDTKNTLYLYKMTISGKDRVQSALFRWTFSVNIEDIFVFNKYLYIVYEGATDSFMLKLPILVTDDIKVDIIDDVGTQQTYESSITLAKWYPKLIDIKTPIDDVLIKKCSFFGNGSFDVDIFRVGYNTTITRTYTSGSTKDASASIAGKSSDVVITIKSNSTENFKITSIVLEGYFKQRTRELR